MLKSLLALALLFTLANCTVYNIANVTQLQNLLTNTTNNFTNGDVINLAPGTYPTAGFTLPSVSLTVQSTGGFATMLSNASLCLIGWSNNGTLTLSNLVFDGCKVYLSNGNSTITNCNFTNVNQSAAAAAVTVAGGRSTMSNVVWDCNAGSASTPADLEVTANGVAVDLDTSLVGSVQYSCSSGSSLTVGGAAQACTSTNPVGTPSCSRYPASAPSPSSVPAPAGVPQPGLQTTGGIIVPGSPAPQGVQPPQVQTPQSAAPQGTPQASGTPEIIVNPGTPAPQGSPNQSPQSATPQTNQNFYCYTGLNTEGSEFNLPTVQCNGVNPTCSMIYYSQSFPRSRAYDCSTQAACNSNSGNSNACCCTTSMCNDKGYNCGNPASALAVSASLLLAVVVMALLY